MASNAITFSLFLSYAAVLYSYCTVFLPFLRACRLVFLTAASCYSRTSPPFTGREAAPSPRRGCSLAANGGAPTHFSARAFAARSKHCALLSTFGRALLSPPLAVPSLSTTTILPLTTCYLLLATW